MIVLACIALYLVVGALTSGYIHVLKERTLGWDNPETFIVGAFWPFSWFWYGFLKPITQIGKWVARKQKKWIFDREWEKKTREADRRIRIAEGMPEVEEFISGEEDTHHAPKRAKR